MLFTTIQTMILPELEDNEEMFNEREVITFYFYKGCDYECNLTSKITQMRTDTSHLREIRELKAGGHTFRRSTQWRCFFSDLAWKLLIDTTLTESKECWWFCKLL